MERLKSLKKLSFTTQKMIPTIGSQNGARTQVYQVWLNLCSSSNIAITFSIELGLRQFKRHLKANTLTYLPIKNHNFLLGWSLSIFSQSHLCFLPFQALNCFCFLIFFSHKFSLEIIPNHQKHHYNHQ